MFSIETSFGSSLRLTSVIVFETAGERYKYALSDVVSGQIVDGNFYIEGASVSGEGEGYGVEGEREVYPSVSFTLDIFEEEESVSSGGPSEDLVENVSIENVSEEVVVEENVSIENVSEVVEDVPQEEVSPLDTIDQTGQVEEVVLEEKEVVENLEGKLPVIKVKYGASDSLIVKINSKVVFDSKTNPTAGSFEIKTTADLFTPENNSVEVEYVEVADDVVSSLEIFITEDAKESDSNWEASEGSGKVSFPISYFSVL